VARIENLCLFPEMGRAVALAPVPSQMRDLTVGRYVVRYAVQDATIVVLRIWHHYEDWK
jgi:plasmid stabilization system protein ParE